MTQLPYREAFFHRSQSPTSLDLGFLPNRDMIFDFALVPGREGKMEANDLALVALLDHARWMPLTAIPDRMGEVRHARPPSRASFSVEESVAFRPNGGDRSASLPSRSGEPTSSGSGFREGSSHPDSPAGPSAPGSPMPGSLFLIVFLSHRDGRPRMIMMISMKRTRPRVKNEVCN